MTKNLLKITLLFIYVTSTAQTKKLVSYEITLKTQKETLFLTSIDEVLKSINNKDSILIDNYIDNQNGIFIFKHSTDNYNFIRKLSFKDPILENLPKKIDNQQIKFLSDSKYECPDGKWNLIGILVDTINTHKPFSKIVENHLGITIMENNSRRIIVSQENEKSFVFYLGYYDQKWWITFLDLRKDHCNEY